VTTYNPDLEMSVTLFDCPGTPIRANLIMPNISFAVENLAVETTIDSVEFKPEDSTCYSCGYNMPIQIHYSSTGPAAFLIECINIDCTTNILYVKSGSSSIEIRAQLSLKITNACIRIRDTKYCKEVTAIPPSNYVVIDGIKSNTSGQVFGSFEISNPFAGLSLFGRGLIYVAIVIVIVIVVVLLISCLCRCIRK